MFQKLLEVTMNSLYINAALICFDNSPYIPELWAREGLAILVEDMVMGSLVHRDFESNIAKFGDVVHTARPAERSIRRRTDSDDYDTTATSATDVPVSLNQWFYDSFIIKDGEQSMSFADLVQKHLDPAMQSMSRAIDRAVYGRISALLKTPTTRAGRLGALSNSNAKDYVLDAREMLHVQKAYELGRNLVLAPSSETAMLKTDLFVKVNESGSDAALRRGFLGKILGFDTFRDNNANSINSTSAVDTAAGTVTAALAAGELASSEATTITGYNVVVGEFVTIAGNDQPQYVTARTLNGADTDDVTLNEANKYASGAGAALTIYKAATAVDAAYAAGWAKAIPVTHTSGKPPQVGQLLAFGTSTRHTYTIIEVAVVSATKTQVWLDRPLEVAVAENDKAFPGPTGSINLAFHRDAIALVSRPVAEPPNGTGVMSAIGSHNGVGMRVVMQYDSVKGGTRVNFDLLAGVAILDPNLAVILLG
jgi:hypothetical protein